MGKTRARPLGPQRAARPAASPRRYGWDEAQRHGAGRASRGLAPRFADHAPRASSTSPGSTPRPRPGKSVGRLFAPGDLRPAPLRLHELHGRAARRADPGPRAGPRRAPDAGRAAGHPAGRHAADAGRDRLDLRRGAGVRPAAGRAPRGPSAATCWPARSRTALNTVVRQIAFHRFETRFHDARGRRASCRPARSAASGWR